jgi:hypothetical protein
MSLVCPCGRPFSNSAISSSRSHAGSAVSREYAESWSGEETEQLGEVLSVTERLVISPTVGVFSPVETMTGTERLEVGTVVGTVAGQTVRSAFSGRLMGILAHPGERVYTGQPIAWLRSDDATVAAVLYTSVD